MGEDADLRSHPRGAQGAAHLRDARRPTLRQRPHPPGHGAQQDAEGLRREVAQHERLRRSLRAWMGLPRTAHRDQGGRSAGPQEARHGSAGGARGVPQVRAEVSRSAALTVQANRRLRPLGQALLDDGSELRERRDGDVLLVLRARAGLQRTEVGLLVRARQDRAGRGGSRIRDAHQPQHLGAVSADQRSWQRSMPRWPARRMSPPSSGPPPRGRCLPRWR